MIAGTLGPTASAFSICALVRPWRQRLAPGGDVETAPFLADPPWLVTELPNVAQDLLTKIASALG